MTKRNELTAPMAIALSIMWEAQKATGERAYCIAETWGAKPQTMRGLERRGIVQRRPGVAVWADLYRITDKGVDWGKP